MTEQRQTINLPKRDEKILGYSGAGIVATFGGSATYGILKLIPNAPVGKVLITFGAVSAYFYMKYFHKNFSIINDKEWQHTFTTISENKN